MREFVEYAFEEIGIKIEWVGEGKDEVGMYDGEVLIKVNPKYYRDIDIECLIGDASKAKQELGWEPTTTFKELVAHMVHHPRQP